MSGVYSSHGREGFLCKVSNLQKDWEATLRGNSLRRGFCYVAPISSERFNVQLGQPVGHLSGGVEVPSKASQRSRKAKQERIVFFYMSVTIADTNETIRALKKSIVHWEENVEEVERALLLDIVPKISLAPAKCALCNKFRVNNPCGKCQGCPIQNKTGRTDCMLTPYGRVADTWFRSLHLNLNFLKELLVELQSPKPESNTTKESIHG